MAAIVDLRSDTVTQPTAGMRTAMASAPLGDDVFGDDPSVNALQDKIAGMLGFEAALFVPTGTQSNLCAILSHCQRGDEYIVGQNAHTYKYEAGGGAVLGSVQPQPIAHQADGSLALADIERAIKPDDFHFARSRLLALENTFGGRVLQPDYLAAATALAHQRGLATHLDGARICNAAVKLGISLREAVKGFDSVSVCLSKGLGAPVGSLLCGSQEFIKQARRWRKMLGGGMRQAGILAAAGLYALEHNVARLAEDHENAARLARGLSDIAQIKVTAPETNMVFADMEAENCPSLQNALERNGILAQVDPHMRIVLHLDVSRADVDRIIAAFKEFFAA